MGAHVDGPRPGGRIGGSDSRARERRAMVTIPMTSADLGRIRFESSPLLNLFRGLSPIVGDQRPTSAHARWLADARRLMPERARPVLDLLTAYSNYAPAFLLPEVPARADRTHRTLEEELDALRATSDRDLALDLAIFDTWNRTRPSPTADALRDRGAALIPMLTDAVRALFASCLAGDWPDLVRAVDAEIAQRARQMAAAGPAAALNDLHPVLSWQPGGLRIHTANSPDWNYDLRDEGLTFSPGVFGPYIGTLIAPGRRSVLAYPLTLSPRPPAADAADGLAALIGRARASALRVIRHEVTTGELAAQLGVTAPTASAHAAALRAAGLVVTERTGRSVRHRLTGLGADLLAANPQ